MYIFMHVNVLESKDTHRDGDIWGNVNMLPTVRQLQTMPSNDEHPARKRSLTRGYIYIYIYNVGFPTRVTRGVIVVLQFRPEVEWRRGANSLPHPKCGDILGGGSLPVASSAEGAPLTAPSVTLAIYQKFLDAGGERPNIAIFRVEEWWWGGGGKQQPGKCCSRDDIGDAMCC